MPSPTLFTASTTAITSRSPPHEQQLRKLAQVNIYTSRPPPYLKHLQLSCPPPLHRSISFDYIDHNRHLDYLRLVLTPHTPQPIVCSLSTLTLVKFNFLSSVGRRLAFRSRNLSTKQHSEFRRDLLFPWYKREGGNFGYGGLKIQHRR